MPQAIQIETQAEQQGLPLLRAQGTTWCTGRELALDRRKQALDQSAAPVHSSWEFPTHHNRARPLAAVQTRNRVNAQGTGWTRSPRGNFRRKLPPTIL